MSAKQPECIQYTESQANDKHPLIIFFLPDGLVGNNPGPHLPELAKPHLDEDILDLIMCIPSNSEVRIHIIWRPNGSPGWELTERVYCLDDFLGDFVRS